MKTLYVTNNTDILPIECDSKVKTRVSEECMTQFTYKSSINPKEVVLKVLLEQLKIHPEDRHNWSLIDPDEE